MKATPAPLLRLALALTLLLAACGSGREEAAAGAAGDTLSREQRDSVLAESKLPGAGAVGAARETSKAASQRASQLDSLQQQ